MSYARTKKTVLKDDVHTKRSHTPHSPNASKHDWKSTGLGVCSGSGIRALDWRKAFPTLVAHHRPNVWHGYGFLRSRSQTVDRPQSARFQPNTIGREEEEEHVDAIGRADVDKERGEKQCEGPP